MINHSLWYLSYLLAFYKSFVRHDLCPYTVYNNIVSHSKERDNDSKQSRIYDFEKNLESREGNKNDGK